MARRDGLRSSARATSECLSHGTGSEPGPRWPSASRGMPKRAGLVPNLAEADDRDRVLEGHVAVVELPEEARHLLRVLQHRVVVLDLVRRQLAEGLDLDLVDHRVEHLLARAVP